MVCMVRVFALVAVYLCVGCGSSPTAPTPPVATVPPPAVTAPPVAVVQPPVVSAPPPQNPLLSDPRFNLAFYRQFVLNGHESPHNLQPLRRHTQAPSIYLTTVDDRGTPIDARTLDSTAAALIHVTGSLTGHFGLEGLERGLGPTDEKPNRITIRWDATTQETACARASVGGRLMIVYLRTANCGCPGVAIRPMIVKHELGHSLGYYHTDSQSDLMHNGGHATCDMEPTEREKFRLCPDQ